MLDQLLWLWIVVPVFFPILLLVLLVFLIPSELLAPILTLVATSILLGITAYKELLYQEIHEPKLFLEANDSLINSARISVEGGGRTEPFPWAHVILASKKTPFASRARGCRVKVVDILNDKGESLPGFLPFALNWVSYGVTLSDLIPGENHPLDLCSLKHGVLWPANGGGSNDFQENHKKTKDWQSYAYYLRITCENIAKPIERTVLISRKDDSERGFTVLLGEWEPDFRERFDIIRPQEPRDN